MALAYRATLAPAPDGPPIVTEPLAETDVHVSSGPASGQAHAARMPTLDLAVPAILVPDQTLPQPAHRVDSPPQTAAAPPPPPGQIAQAVISATDHQIDLSLAPEELGRVQLTLHQDGEVMRVHIVADRPETLDLLRRHAGELAQDLRAAGHDGASFSFGGSPRDQPAHAPMTADTDPHSPPRPPAPRGHDGALDLRL